MPVFGWSVYTYAAIAALILFDICGVSNLFAAPHLPSPISWSGTKELAAGSSASALAAVMRDTAAGADTLLRLFKIGAINVSLGKSADAAAALNRVNKGDPVLAPLAMERIGDAAAAASGGEHIALLAYSAALKASGLPANYRRHIFAKMKAITDLGTPLPDKQPWAAEYKTWYAKQRLFDAAGLEAVCDSLVKAGQLAEADSILEQHLPELNKNEVCGVVNRMFQHRSSDTATLTTKFLISLASQANGCRDFVAAERLLGIAQKRADFTTAVPERKSLLLAANIAYGREQWKKAADLYKKYDTAYGPDSDVLMNTARAYRNLGNTEQASAWYDRHVKNFPSHAKTQEILWLRAWNLEDNGNFKPAAAAYRRIFNTTGNRTEEAYIRHALCYYRLHEYDSAIIYLNTFQKKYPQSSYLWSGMFWQGKCYAAKKKPEEARKIWSNLAKLDPTDYYAHRARQLMGEPDSASFILTSVLALDTPEARARVWLDSISPAQKKKLSAKDSINLRRGAALLSIARADLAEFFLDDYERNYHSNLLLQYDLAIAYALAGSEARSFSVARRLSWRIPMEHRETVPVHVQAVMFPPFYSRVISKHAAEFNIDPLFVTAVMRQESIFDKDIVSPAGARGLMQIMPNTGKDIAARLKVKYHDDSLFHYSYNIRFGAHYLKRRLDQFNGSHVLALCSYNAGPHNAIKWQERNKKLEYDLFVEDIGFRETRGYVKKVMGNYWTYKGLVKIPGYNYETVKPEENYLWYPWAIER
jgi:soluble lytic murein transglycosylase-like protein